MIHLTPVASTKVKEIMGLQNPSPTALRVAVVGGGLFRIPVPHGVRESDQRDRRGFRL